MSCWIATLRDLSSIHAANKNITWIFDGHSPPRKAMANQQTISCRNGLLNRSALNYRSHTCAYATCKCRETNLRFVLREWKKKTLPYILLETQYIYLLNLLIIPKGLCQMLEKMSENGGILMDHFFSAEERRSTLSFRCQLVL